MNTLLVLTALAFSLIFESLGAYPAGTYTFATLMGLTFFFVSPIKFWWLNGLIITLISATAIWLRLIYNFGWQVLSLSFLSHIFLFAFIFVVIIFYEKKIFSQQR